MKELQFTFITSTEKLEIMMCQPERENICYIKQKILNNRFFNDEKTKKIFENHLEKIIYNRSLGKPKRLKKPSDYLSSK